MFVFGIEHEVAFLDRDGRFVDFVATSFEDLNAIIAKLPLYKEDYPQLRIGDAGIRWKRWYIEGFERFDVSGKTVGYMPKGIEIRTTIHPTIKGAIDELAESFRLLVDEAAGVGFVPVLTSFHPYRTTFVPDPPLNGYEEQELQLSPEERTSFVTMLTYGPDLNLSMQGLDADAIIDIGRKLTYYSPYIVPFSFSSPFYEGTLWQGLSVRTFMRTGARPAVLVFLAQPTEMIASDPSLTKIARIPAEVGRIEFKACDSCADFALYAGLFALLKGLILDEMLSGRATVPDAALHQVSARQGFASDDILAGTQAVLQAAQRALGADADAHLLGPLHAMLQRRTTPAHDLIRSFRQTGAIEKALRFPYQYSFE